MPYNAFDTFVQEGKIPHDFGPLEKRNLSSSN